MDMSAGLSSIRVSSESKQGSKFDQMGRAYKQVSIQYNCTKFYSFRVTKSIIGAGRWHGPIILE